MQTRSTFAGSHMIFSSSALTLIGRPVSGTKSCLSPPNMSAWVTCSLHPMSFYKLLQSTAFNSPTICHTECNLRWRSSDSCKNHLTSEKDSSKILKQPYKLVLSRIFLTHNTQVLSSTLYPVYSSLLVLVIYYFGANQGFGLQQENPFRKTLPFKTVSMLLCSAQKELSGKPKIFRQ